MNNVIVTGANGFLGSSLIHILLQNNVYVVAIDISCSHLKAITSENLFLIEDDLSDVESLMQNIPSCPYDAMYHFAWRGVNGAEKADPIIQVKNIEMVLRCAKIASLLGCKKYLCAGTIAERAVDSLPKLSQVSGGMMYGTAKYAAHKMLETYCKNVGQAFVWMQFSNIYGAQNKTGNLISYTLNQLNKGEDATFGPAEQVYDFIYIDDLINAIYLLGDRNTTRNQYFIGSGTPRILKDYLLTVGELCEKEENIKIGVLLDDGVKYTEDMFDISKTVKDIGSYTPLTFEERMKYTIEHY